MAPSKVPTRTWHALPLAELSKAHQSKPAEVINCLKPRKSSHPAGFGHQLDMRKNACLIQYEGLRVARHEHSQPTDCLADHGGRAVLDYRQHDRKMV